MHMYICAYTKHTSHLGAWWVCVHRKKVVKKQRDMGCYWIVEKSESRCCANYSCIVTFCFCCLTKKSRGKAWLREDKWVKLMQQEGFCQHKTTNEDRWGTPAETINFGSRRKGNSVVVFFSWRVFVSIPIIFNGSFAPSAPCPKTSPSEMNFV